MAILLVMLAACVGPNKSFAGPTGDGGPTQTAVAGVVKGHASYADGRPLQNAFVQIRRSDGLIDDVTVRTDASGNYSKSLGAGSYQVGAYVRVQYQGKAYQMGLDPVGGIQTFSAAQGYAKNFQLKVHGEITQSPQPGNGQLGYWGVTATVNWSDTSQKNSSVDVVIPPGIQFEMTFKPNGPLIDGSRGETKVYRIDPNGKGVAGAFNVFPDPIKDLPIGSYMVTARFVGGATDALEIMDSYHPGQPMASSVLMIPEPDSFGTIMTNPGLYLRTCCIQFQLNVWKRAGSTNGPAGTPTPTEATTPGAQSPSAPSSAPTAPPTSAPQATPCTGTAQIVPGPDSPQPPGTVVILSASGAGAGFNCPSGSQFQFIVTDPSGATAIAQPWTASSTYTWDTTGLGPGAYVWRLEIKDSTSNQADVSAGLTYTVT
jgi:hypothetical protein